MVNLVFVNDAPRKGSEDLGGFDAKRHQVRSHAAAYAHRRKQAKQALQSEVRVIDQHRHGSYIVEANLDRRTSSDAKTPALLSRNSTDSSCSSLSTFSAASPSSPESSISIDDCDDNNGKSYDNDDISRDAYESASPHIDYSSSLFSNDFGCYRGMRTDPFNQVAPKAYPLMDYFTLRVVPSLAVTFKIFNVNSWTTHDFFRLLQDDDCYYACSAWVQLIFDSHRSPDEPLSQDFLKMYNTGLVRLRRRLKRQRGRADAAVVFAALALAVTASMTGDMEAFRTHASSLPLLIRSQSGPNAPGQARFIDLLVKQLKSIWSRSPQLETPEQCKTARYELPDFVSWPFSSKIEQLVRKLPLGFQQLARAGYLSVKTLEVLARTAEAHSSKAASRFKFQDDQREHYLHTSRPYDDWHEACPALENSLRDTRCVLEAMIVHALFLYIMHSFSPLRYAGPSYIGFRTKLSSSIMAKHQLCHAETGDVMVWIWMSLVDSWTAETGDKLLPKGIELMQSMRASFTNFHGPIPMLSKLVLFFTNPEFERRCLKYWHAVEIL